MLNNMNRQKIVNRMDALIKKKEAMRIEYGYKEDEYIGVKKYHRVYNKIDKCAVELIAIDYEDVDKECIKTV